MFKTTAVLFDEIYLGMVVKEHWTGYTGTVIKCKDINNVIVKYYPQGYGFLCLDPSCKNYDTIYEEKKDIENGLIKCKCGEVLYIFKDSVTCSACNEVLTKIF